MSNREWNSDQGVGDRWANKLHAVPGERPMVHPQTVDAFMAELEAASARELRLLLEISNLHQALGYVRACCETALAHCMHPGSNQATALHEAIAKTKDPVP